jgi:hypothetical protein
VAGWEELCAGEAAVLQGKTVLQLFRRVQACSRNLGNLHRCVI